MYNIYHMNENYWFEVEEAWLKGIVDLEGATDVDYFTTPKEKIKVTYYNGNMIYYEKVKGIWGLPKIK